MRWGARGRGWGGGRARAPTRPGSPRSATCKQAPGGQDCAGPAAQPGLETGYPKVRLRAAHPYCQGPLPVYPPLFPSPSSAGSHTPPSALPAPGTALPTAPGFTPRREPAPPEVSPHSSTPPPLRPCSAERRNTLETHQTHLGMAENRTQLGKFKNRPSSQKSKRALQSLSPGRPSPRGDSGGRRGRAPGQPERGQGAGMAPTSARAWARYPQPRSSRQAQVLIASRGAGGSARRRGRGAGTPAGLLCWRNSVPSLRERGPEEGGAESSEPVERARREQRVQRGRQRQPGGGAGSARPPHPSRREPPGPPGRGWGRKGRRAGAGPLPWWVPGAGRRRARSPAQALGAIWPVIQHVCGRQPREGAWNEAGAAAAPPPPPTITCLDARPGPGLGLALSLQAASGPALASGLF